MIGPSNVIDRPFVFVQRPLLEASEFEKAAAERGCALPPDGLERLHRSRVLMPLYSVRRPRRDILARRRAASRRELSGAGLWEVPKRGPDLVVDHHDRLVTDGEKVRYRPWRREEVATPSGRVRRREYLYSSYQLLDLDLAEQAFALYDAGNRTKWARTSMAILRQEATRRRALVALLTLLEPRYLPDIIGGYRVSDFGALDEFEKFATAWDPASVLRNSGWDGEELYDAATRLIHRADSVDPLRDWLDVVRLAHPDKWERLRGRARYAIDLRVAGEILLRLHEDAQRVDALSPYPVVPPRVQHPLNRRLKPDRSVLDDVLMDFGLSPHPAVVLALEGPTEHMLAPLVMDLLGIPSRDSFIRLVDAGGEDRDHGFLATYVSLPKLGAARNGVAEFMRPPTRYLLAVDGDREFKNAAAREAKRQTWIGILVNSLPSEYQTPEARTDLDEFVIVEAWGDGVDFERAHFSDQELATAIMATGTAPASLTADVLAAKLVESRIRGTNLKSVWSGWKLKPDKVLVAQHLWPVLRNRLEQRLHDASLLGEVPIARVLMRAYELAVRTPRRHVVMRVGGDRQS